jgi:hypothetical protein
LHRSGRGDISIIDLALKKIHGWMAATAPESLWQLE